MCEDYRAAATIDLEHDRASRAAGDEGAVPDAGAVGRQGQDRRSGTMPLAIWRQYCAADGDRRRRSTAGHYLAEEAPEATLEWFEKFF